MTYTQKTTVPGKPTRTREITESTLIRLMSQVVINKQCGEINEWRCIYTPDYTRVIRYELIRQLKGIGEAVTHFIPNGEQETELE